MPSKRKSSSSLFCRPKTKHHRDPAKRRRLTVENLEERRVLTGMPFGATEFDLGEFFLGTVAVTPVFLESNGDVDTSTEDWTTAHINEVLANINEGLNWWSDTLDAMNTVHELQFTVDTTYAATPVETSYEPISRRSNDYSLYLTEFLQLTGFNNTGNLERDMLSFNQSQREKFDTNWAFTMLVVPSVNDADGQFASGGSFSRAFAFAGGLFMVVPSTRPASTFAHETAHIFWGRDEYAGGGSYFQRRGYYNTQNLNAFDNPTPGFVQQPSIMASGSLLETAYTSHTSPESTLAMVGWQDSDGDGIFDLLDVPHRLTGSGYFDADQQNYRFTGHASVQTLPNLNSAGLGNDITINRISEIQYRFGTNGAWQVLSSPDTYETSLDLTIPVPEGESEIEIRAVDSNSGVSSNVFAGRLSRADAVSEIGIDGFIWIDQNKNDLRDLGEFGQEFWTVELVDGADTPLNLRKTVEPDDYPDGQLASNFHPDLILSAVGTDADGRVGVFADSVTSTGSKNFRGFSRSSQSYLSSWNSQSRKLEITFSSPTGVVSIDAIGTSLDSYGRLDAYNAAGELVGRYTSSPLGLGDVETLNLTRVQADIARVIVGGHANSSVRLDNLQFGPTTSVLTDALGHYQFVGLPAGDYNVKVTPPNGFIATQPTGGKQSVTVVSNTPTTDIDFGFESSVSDWQNQLNVNDVNADTFVTALDVLLIVNEINQNGARDLRDSGLTVPPYVDSSGDSFLSALDVLLVVNHINQHGAGEGEAGQSVPGLESPKSCHAWETATQLIDPADSIAGEGEASDDSPTSVRRTELSDLAISSLYGLELQKAAQASPWKIKDLKEVQLSSNLADRQS